MLLIGILIVVLSIVAIRCHIEDWDDVLHIPLTLLLVIGTCLTVFGIVSLAASASVPEAINCAAPKSLVAVKLRGTTDLIPVQHYQCVQGMGQYTVRIPASGSVITLKEGDLE